MGGLSLGTGLIAEPPSLLGPGKVWAGGISDTLAVNDPSANACETNLTKLQAALDYGYNNATGVVHVSFGSMYCDSGLYVDAPGNLRADLENPSIFAFSMVLQGVGRGNHENHGTRLIFPDNTQPAVYLGTGQRMGLRKLCISGPSGATSRAALPGNGKGLLIAGGSGGSSDTLVDDVLVEHFREAYSQGPNNNALGDAVTLRKARADHCFYGHAIRGTQNYIISHDDCVFSGCKIPVYSPVGKAVIIKGGNYSTVDAKAAAFAIGSVSALDPFSDSFAGSTFTNWMFTATLAADDQPMRDGAYDAFCIVTTAFGVIPLVLLDYNSSTRVATFAFYVGWLTSHYAAIDIEATTDIAAALQAADTLYACEMVTPFSGVGFDIDGAHVENPEVLTQLLTTETGFVGDRVSVVRKVFLNYEINHQSVADGTDAQKAAYHCQQVFPWIRQVDAGIVLEHAKFSGSGVGLGSDGVNIEIRGNTLTHRFISQNVDLYNPNITVPLYDHVGDVTLQPSMAVGAGEWDSTPFIAAAESSQFYAFPRLNAVRFRGWLPDPDKNPRLTAAQLAAIEGGPGGLGTYPLLCGDTLYSVLDGDTMFARSRHTMWSYGQDLSINWTYLGQSTVLRVSNTTRLIAGLRITLDNGSGDQSYTITGVYPTLGYVTVSAPLAGTKTVTYNGSVIKQAAYSVIKLSSMTNVMVMET